MTDTEYIIGNRKTEIKQKNCQEVKRTLNELFEAAKQLQVPYELVLFVHENKKLPVVNFAAGGVATPAMPL